MSFFLFKPHVDGPKGITTPDLIVDRLLVDGEDQALALLGSQNELQVTGNQAARPAYALCAAGGGTLISPALQLNDGRISVARKAWRFNAVADHVGMIALNGSSLNVVGLPAAAAAGHSDDANQLPRGLMLVTTAHGTESHASLTDAVLERELSHHPRLLLLTDPTMRAPAADSRYAIGPTRKKVEHYI